MEQTDDLLEQVKKLKEESKESEVKIDELERNLKTKQMEVDTLEGIPVHLLLKKWS